MVLESSSVVACLEVLVARGWAVHVARVGRAAGAGPGPASRHGRRLLVSLVVAGVHGTVV